MAYKFYTDKKQYTEEKKAYAAYAIIESYFHRSSCKNPFLLTRLHLHYAEGNNHQREEWEAQAIRAAEGVLAPYEEIFAVMNCEVSIKKMKGGYVLEFETGFERVVAEVTGKEMKVHLSNQMMRVK